MKAKRKFIIIDDDPINNFICKEIINLTFEKPITIIDFTNALKCLEYIVANFTTDSENIPVVLFVDINMPIMSGWEFLEKFAELDEQVKKLFQIYIISSSINPSDREQATLNPYVRDYITKPISEEFLVRVAG
jgi:CheY-like chemotaxis protein